MTVALPKKQFSGGLKFIAGWLICFGIRLIPFRPPNFEPLTATLMPFAKKYGYAGSFFFGFLSIALFDLAVNKIGIWTLITGLAFGLLGLGATWFFRKREAKILNFVKFSIVATIFYDASTGLTIGPLFWGQSFQEALLGQIPFTLMHLLGNIIFAVLVSPAIYRWVVKNPSLEISWFRKKILKTA